MSALARRGASLKSIFLGLLALPPAANALGSIFFAPLLRPKRRAMDQVRVPRGILSDHRWGANPVPADLPDMTGHHRYYGRSAYVFEERQAPHD